MSLIRSATQGHVLSHPSYHKYTCAPLSKLPSCAPFYCQCKSYVICIEVTLLAVRPFVRIVLVLYHLERKLYVPTKGGKEVCCWLDRINKKGKQLEYIVWYYYIQLMEEERDTGKTVRLVC